MANEINILERALPRKQALLPPEALPNTTQLDQMALLIEKLRRSCRLVTLDNNERLEMSTPLTLKEIQLTESLAALVSHFPFMAPVLGVDPQLFEKLKWLGLALDQLEAAAAELESADQSCQIIILRGITEDVDRVDAVLAQRADQSLDRIAFSPMLKVRDLARIRALAKAERTRSRQQAEQQAISTEAQQQETLKRAPRIIELKKKESP